MLSLYQNAPQEVIDAFELVKSHHPEVVEVEFFEDIGIDNEILNKARIKINTLELAPIKYTI